MESLALDEKSKDGVDAKIFKALFLEYLLRLKLAQFIIVRKGIHTITPRVGNVVRERLNAKVSHTATCDTNISTALKVAYANCAQYNCYKKRLRSIVY